MGRRGRSASRQRPCPSDTFGPLGAASDVSNPRCPRSLPPPGSRRTSLSTPRPIDARPGWRHNAELACTHPDPGTNRARHAACAQLALAQAPSHASPRVIARHRCGVMSRHPGVGALCASPESVATAQHRRATHRQRFRGENAARRANIPTFVAWSARKRRASGGARCRWSACTAMRGTPPAPLRIAPRDRTSLAAAPARATSTVAGELRRIVVPTVF